MNLSKKDRTIKYICYCLVIFASALLQNVDGLFLSVGGARCLFLIPVAVLIGIDEDERVSATFGLLAGGVWDAVSVQHSGFNLVFLMLVCYFSSALVTYLLVSTYWVKTVMCLVAELIYVLLYWLLFVVIKGGDGAVESVLYFYLPCFLFTGVVTLVLVPLIAELCRKLNKEPKVD